MTIGQLKEPVELYQKRYIPDGKGGFSNKWHSLGTLWVALHPCSIPYPLPQNGHAYGGKGEAYRLTAREDARLGQTHGLIWNKRFFRLLETVGHKTKGYVTVKIASGLPPEPQTLEVLS